MFKCSYSVDLKMQKEINAKTSLFSLVFTIISSIGLIVYIFLPNENYYTELLLWSSSIIFGFSIVLYINLKRINKKTSKNNFINEVELNEDHLVSKSTQNGELISTIKVYYKDLLKIRETTNYLVLYVNKVSAVPIPKQDFSSEELSTIKVWIASLNSKFCFKNNKKD